MFGAGTLKDLLGELGQYLESKTGTPALQWTIAEVVKLGDDVIDQFLGTPQAKKCLAPNK